MRKQRRNRHHDYTVPLRNLVYRKRARRYPRIVRDVDRLRGVKAARTRLINRTVERILAAFDVSECGTLNSERIRAILEDVL